MNIADGRAVDRGAAAAVRRRRARAPGAAAASVAARCWRRRASRARWTSCRRARWRRRSTRRRASWARQLEGRAFRGLHHAGAGASSSTSRALKRRAARTFVSRCSTRRARSDSSGCTSTSSSRARGGRAAAARQFAEPALAANFETRAERESGRAVRSRTDGLTRRVDCSSRLSPERRAEALHRVVSSTTPRARSRARSSTTGPAGPERRRTCTTSTARCPTTGKARWCRSRRRPTARCSSTSCRSISARSPASRRKFQLYTVPGQVYYQTTRKLVLQGADGVVFVADSQARQLEENIESFQDLHANLAEQGIDARADAARAFSTTSRICRAI